MTYIIVASIGIVLGILAVITLVRSYGRQGTVRAAIDTVSLLTAKSNELEKQVHALTTKLAVLTEMVTQRAEVKELAEKQEQRHEENILLLTRLEGSLSRLESHVILGKG